ncbi:V-set and transmembrane domain-containing protein 4 isoform X1 [Rhineura floridana]|uniref:V-set and transmembrane domain-containing protein 4 isoform X1 n=1 Tax=Rhineura floridana TaxID=261503 RepID=UPI002AC817D8|nr:V-set and transmembrane domain-containing protein 4 isoform X1 [Rhineura floridana]
MTEAEILNRRRRKGRKEDGKGRRGRWIGESRRRERSRVASLSFLSLQAMRLLVPIVLLLGTPVVCKALNVTVSPGPRVQYVVGDNATLFCHVSQKKQIENLLAVRWVFALPPTQEYLMIKMTKYGVVQYYGNYTRHFYKQRLHLLEEKQRTMYTFFILNLQQADQGHYICKVQEIGKHRNKWTAWSHGSASTKIEVISSKDSDDSTAERNHKAWKFFEDLYVYAVFVCSIGIVGVLLFTLVVLCQTLINKKHSRVKHYLVKCSKNSLGETVTSVTSLSAVQSIQIKRKKKAEQPPAIPAKAPISNTFSNPKLLKPQRKILLPKIADENLTYAELELIKPHQETKGIPTMTVYAQILFEENKM